MEREISQTSELRASVMKVAFILASVDTAGASAPEWSPADGFGEVSLSAVDLVFSSACPPPIAPPISGKRFPNLLSPCSTDGGGGVPTSADCVSAGDVVPTFGFNTASAGGGARHFVC